MAQDPLPQDLDFEIDEDLFNFDDLLVGTTDSMAELDAALDHTMSTVTNLEVAEPAPKPAATFTPQARPAPLSPEQVETGVARRSRDSAPAATPGAPALSAPATRLNPLVVAGVLGSLVLNAVLVAFAIPALRAVSNLQLSDPGGSVSAAPSIDPLAEERPGAGRIERPMPLDLSIASEGGRALERARDALSASEFERGRQILCALLSVADRLPPDERRDVEARARFLLADAWRLEADFQERGSIPIAAVVDEGVRQ